MWTCPKCKEEIGDEFDSCWKCARVAQPSLPSGKVKKPLEQWEPLCILLVGLPGILFLARGGTQNPEQAAFRIAAVVIGLSVGLGGFAAIKIYQKRRARK